MAEITKQASIANNSEMRVGISSDGMSFKKSNFKNKA
jgi:hypothetical protein